MAPFGSPTTARVPSVYPRAGCTQPVIWSRVRNSAALRWLEFASLAYPANPTARRRRRERARPAAECGESEEERRGVEAMGPFLGAPSSLQCNMQYRTALQNAWHSQCHGMRICGEIRRVRAERCVYCIWMLKRRRWDSAPRAARLELQSHTDGADGAGHGEEEGGLVRLPAASSQAILDGTKMCSTILRLQCRRLWPFCRGRLRRRWHVGRWETIVTGDRGRARVTHSVPLCSTSCVRVIIRLGRGEPLQSPLCRPLPVDKQHRWQMHSDVAHGGWATLPPTPFHSQSTSTVSWMDETRRPRGATSTVASGSLANRSR